jgi:hypothetical protein
VDAGGDKLLGIVNKSGASMRKSQSLVVLSLVLAGFFLVNPLAQSAKPSQAPSESFDRAQTLLINLNKVQGSSGYYLLEGLRFTETMDHDLLKALRQVQEVDKKYGSLRNRPDSRHLEETAIKIDRAIQANTQSISDLKDAYTELKAQIKETLALDELKGAPQQQQPKFKSKDKG